jgi:hypothetical protein
VAGSLGVGTTSPLANLHVANASNGLGTFNVGGTTSALGIQMEYSQGGFTTSTIYANNSYNDNGAVLKIGVGKTSNPNQLVLLGSGNVLIGTTIDGGQKLQVSGTGYISGNLSSGARITAGNGLTATSTVPTVVAASTNLDYNSVGAKGRLFVWGPDAGTVAGFDLNLANSTNSSLITALSFDSSGNAILAGLAVLNESKSIRWTSGGTVGGTIRAQITADSSYLTLDSQTSNPILLQCNSATVLTLEPTNSKATFAGRINAAGLPTSNVGLAAGELWVDTAAGNVVKRN